MAASLVYRLRGVEPLILREFDDDIVAFDPATWDTHVLDSAAAIVLAELQRGPCDEPALVEAIARAAGTTQGAARFTAALLADLTAVNIVEALPLGPPR